MKVYLLGTAYPYRGGLASFNERLMKEFDGCGHETKIINFSLQYPSLLFPGKSQYVDGGKPPDITIERKLNSINPANWYVVGNYIAREKPDLLIIKYWLPFMGPAFGTVARRVKKNNHTKMACILDNLIPHESRPGDGIFTSYFVKPIDHFIAMSRKVQDDLTSHFPSKTCNYHPHPIFDNFGKAISQNEARKKLGLNTKKKYILFFGFIREYKGLGLLIEAFAKVMDDLPDVDLIVAGEFYDDREKYDRLIKTHKILNRLHLFHEFIPNEDVVNFFCAADVIVQPYKSATQSGVTQIAYHFDKPMIVTDVGGLPEIVSDGVSGFISKVDPHDLAQKINQFFSLTDIKEMSLSVAEEKKRFSWNAMMEQLIDSVKVHSSVK